MKKLSLSLLSISIYITVFADIRLPAVISSHMVLQQKSTVKIWGWSEPGEKISLNTDWDTTTYKTVGSSGAKWSIDIKTPAGGGPYKISLKGYNSIVLEDVLVGEVWVCSGQSNMEMNVNWGLPYANEVANAANNNIRFFNVSKTTADAPQEDLKANWVVSDSTSMKKFSAIGYFFGQKLQQELNVPIGLINASWGGTPAEVWTPEEYIKADTLLTNAAAKLTPSDHWPVTPAATYNAMIYPLTKFSIAGTIWYQGESNVGTAYAYKQLFTTMIGAWRKAWNKEFPFYYVQIAPFAGYGDSISAAFLREAQTKAMQYPNTGMVITSDLVDNINDIHPKLKKEVGLRLANYALAQTYSKNGLAYKSPVYKSMKIEKNKIRVFFDNADKGLMSKNGPPSGFYIAGENGHFVPAQAKIDGNTVVVWNKDIKSPTAVRFGFTSAAMANLFSTEGLPVNLFRTDNNQSDGRSASK